MDELYFYLIDEIGADEKDYSMNVCENENMMKLEIN